MNKEFKPTAWLHILGNEENCPGTEPLQKLSFLKESPFGLPGRDHSIGFPVISIPLFSCLSEVKKKEWVLINRSAEYVGNSPVFWRKGGSGYTQWIDEAELFTEEEADRTVNSSRGTHNFEKFKFDFIESLSKRTVDIQDVRKAQREKND